MEYVYFKEGRNDGDSKYVITFSGIFKSQELCYAKKEAMARENERVCFACEKVSLSILFSTSLFPLKTIHFYAEVGDFYLKKILLSYFR